ncbi:YihY/virulence factor BrkB family protein [Rhodohalobacter sp. SW132]|uniref:YihY/virulence factor BrkB family protein n=1 Tax=Rhodohalobacter sp. SW132 TaxID=2293433 RepID=UPI000E230FE3|nr:YihY/virulence factor BrkB family protein [Rhodohalobacter sp. SW132]REL24071.1 YihY/virulence factor BrkB family protein [Rhodohalobacter sp. SW132]
MKIELPDFKTVYNDVKELLANTFKKAVDDDILTQGAAIAFYTVFSIAPLFILIVSVSGIFLSEEFIAIQVEEYIAELAGDDIAENLNQFLEEVSYSATGFFATIMAAFIVAFGATTVITQLKQTLNRIWNVVDVEINSIWNFLLNRLLSFGVIILISFLLIASLLTEAIIGVVTGFFTQAVPDINLDFYRIISELMTIAFAVAFFTLIFKILPDVNANWSDILVGAIATTILFLLGKYLIGIYMTSSAISATYRAAGSLIIFIVWVYYNIQTILLGAVFTQVYTEKFGGKIIPYKFVKMRESPYKRREPESAESN